MSTKDTPGEARSSEGLGLLPAHPEPHTCQWTAQEQRAILAYTTYCVCVAVATELERICAAIKAEDDYCADRDYMLDSDDCINVARGQWVRPE